jgi:hypothetical protein
MKTRARFARVFIDRKRIHIGAQSGRFAGQRAANDADYAGLRNAPVLDPKLIQFALDQRRRLVLFEPKFRMTMNLTPKRNRALARSSGNGSHAIKNDTVRTPVLQCRPC